MMQILLQKPLSAAQMQELLTLLQSFLPPDMIFISQNGQTIPIAAEKEKTDTAANCFYLKSKDRYIKIAVNDIFWVKGDGAGVKIVTENGDFSGMVNLQSFMKQIQYPQLLRIHKSYVVNKYKITAFDAGAVYIQYKGKVEVVAIGITYREEFKNHFPRLLAD